MMSMDVLKTGSAVRGALTALKNEYAYDADDPEKRRYSTRTAAHKKAVESFEERITKELYETLAAMYEKSAILSSVWWL